MTSVTQSTQPAWQLRTDPSGVAPITVVVDPTLGVASLVLALWVRRS